MDPHALPPVLRSLLRPEAYPHPVASIELVETQISWVLLTGPFAYKIKRPVQYPFVDLRSAEHRAFLCREEIRLNRRFAPELYLDVCAITIDGGSARIGGAGPAVEHAVRMTQFRRDDELPRRLETGRTGTDALEEFGRDLARIHERLPVVPTGEPWGTPERIRAIVLENFEQTLQAAASFPCSAALSALRPGLERRLAVRADAMASRRAAGRVRECHGDLHASNVVARDDRLVAFDCLEFAPAFRWIDVADDVAFLKMDLAASGYGECAHAFLAGYLAESGDYDACRVLDVCLAHRALVRAKVKALALPALALAPEAERHAALRRLDAYVGAAGAALAASSPCLVLMQGFSGSGKTWLARQLAPRLGAVHLRSDVERKRLAGLPETARSGSPVGEGLYGPDASARTYGHLVRCAEQVLDGGLPAIVDAAFGRREERARFRDLAARLGVPLRVVHCGAAADVLKRRLRERGARADDASEANLAVLQWQQAHAEPLAASEGLRVIEVDTTRDDPAPSVAGLARVLAAGG